MKAIIFSIIVLLTSTNVVAQSMSSDAIARAILQDKEEYQNVVDLMKNQQIQEALNALEILLDTSTNDLILLQSKLLYSGLVLDYAYMDEKKVSKAVSIMLPLALEKKLPEYQFITANLLFIQQKFDLADVFLEDACTSPKIDKKLLARCNSLAHIDNGKPMNITRTGECAEKRGLYEY